jgi:peptidoglycan/LPS O-acetylase OafA/YrhL
MGLLRLWLAFAVLRHHATALGNGWMPAGEAAVQAFFVMSGFAMAMVLEQKYAFDRRAFWLRRAVRLWPAYLAALALMLAYGGWLWSRHISVGVFQELQAGPPPSAGAWAVLAFSNLSMVDLDLLALLGLRPGGGMYLTADPFNGGFVAWRYVVLPQAWSLSVELLFYALAPWYVRLSTRSLAAVFLGGVALRLALMRAGLPASPWAIRLAPIELSTFALGILAWRAYRAWGPIPSPRRAALASAAGWALVLAAPQLCATLPGQSLALALATALALPWIFGAARAWAWDRVFGEWAYPFYLLQTLVSYAAMDVAATLHWTPRFWALVLACLAAAILLWWGLRRPLAWLDRRLAPIKEEAHRV